MRDEHHEIPTGHLAVPGIGQQSPPQSQFEILPTGHLLRRFLHHRKPVTTDQDEAAIGTENRLHPQILLPDQFHAGLGADGPLVADQRHRLDVDDRSVLHHGGPRAAGQGEPGRPGFDGNPIRNQILPRERLPDPPDVAGTVTGDDIDQSIQPVQFEFVVLETTEDERVRTRQPGVQPDERPTHFVPVRPQGVDAHLEPVAHDPGRRGTFAVFGHGMRFVRHATADDGDREPGRNEPNRLHPFSAAAPDSLMRSISCLTRAHPRRW